MGEMARTTQLLETSVGGDEAARAELMRLVLPELKERARAAMAREPAGHTLQPTALVNEVFLRMVDQNQVSWQGQTHFFAVAAVALRRVLVDYARRRKAAKRGGGWERIPWADAADGKPAQQIDLLDLEDALAELAVHDERAAHVVELRYFGQLNDDQIAAELGISERTVRNDWTHARAWLNQRLREGTD